MLKLEAVRQMLELTGLQHISALDTDGASTASFAERVLDRECVDLQRRGWHFNTRQSITLSPTLYDVSNASWDPVTSRLTQTDAFTDATVGQTLTITAGATTLGDVLVTGVDSGGAFISIDTAIDPAPIASGVTATAVNNKLTLPESALSIDSEDWNDVVQLGSKLYDRVNNTTMFEDDVCVTYIAFIEFECLPDDFAHYITMVAAERFASAYATDQSRIGYIGMKLRDAKGIWNRANLDASDCNVLNSTFARDVRGGRGRTGRYGIWSSY